MRLISKVKNNEKIKRVMIFDSGDGVYLFLYNKDEDGPSFADHWYDSIEEAKETCVDLMIQEHDWTEIDDPCPTCRHDWISPVRSKGRADGQSNKEYFEIFVNDKWVDL